MLQAVPSAETYSRIQCFRKFQPRRNTCCALEREKPSGLFPCYYAAVIKKMVLNVTQGTVFQVVIVTDVQHGEIYLLVLYRLKESCTTISGELGISFNTGNLDFFLVLIKSVVAIDVSPSYNKNIKSYQITFHLNVNK